MLKDLAEEPNLGLTNNYKLASQRRHQGNPALLDQERGLHRLRSTRGAKPEDSAARTQESLNRVPQARVRPDGSYGHKVCGLQEVSPGEQLLKAPVFHLHAFQTELPDNLPEKGGLSHLHLDKNQPKLGPGQQKRNPRRAAPRTHVNTEPVLVARIPGRDKGLDYQSVDCLVRQRVQRQGCEVYAPVPLLQKVKVELDLGQKTNRRVQTKTLCAPHNP